LPQCLHRLLCLLLRLQRVRIICLEALRINLPLDSCMTGCICYVISRKGHTM
jgi:hypothetical protein